MPTHTLLGEYIQGGRGMYPFFAFYREADGYLPATSGFKDYRKFLLDLEDAIQDEAAAIRFYQQLMNLAPTAEQRDLIKHAHEDEIEHFKMFTRLYRQLTGREARVQVEDIPVSDYKEGIKKAFKNELAAAESYRDMYLSVQITEIRDLLFLAMTDEMEHAQRFTFILLEL